jgi:hypothetical protein
LSILLVPVCLECVQLETSVVTVHGYRPIPNQMVCFWDQNLVDHRRLCTLIQQTYLMYRKQCKATLANFRISENLHMLKIMWQPLTFSTVWWQSQHTISCKVTYVFTAGHPLCNSLSCNSLLCFSMDHGTLYSLHAIHAQHL